MSLRFLAAGASLALVSMAAAHNHVTVDTDGAQAIATVGFLMPESGYTLDDDGQVLLDGQVRIYTMPAVIDEDGSPVDGWFANGTDNPVLTSDFFAGTGRLDGGDFRFEIAAVEHLAGEKGDFAWLLAHDGELEVRAASTGATRAERSFTVGFGGHEHGQVMAASSDGLHDVVLVIWDANGVYADAAPIRIRVGEAAICSSDLDQDGAVNFGDILVVLENWGPCPPSPHGCAGDVNEDDVVDFGDIVVILSDWGPCA